MLSFQGRGGLSNRGPEHLYKLSIGTNVFSSFLTTPVRPAPAVVLDTVYSAAMAAKALSPGDNMQNL